LCLGFFAFATLPLVDAYVLLFCTPIMISVLAIFFLGERIAVVRWLAILLGLIGVLIVLRPSIDSVKIGHLAALCSALCGAISAIISRKIGSSENMATMIVFPLLATILVSGVMLLYVYEPMPLSDLGLMFLVGALGLLGQYLILSGYRIAPAAYIAPMQYSQIIWAILFGYLFFNEAVDRYVILGSAITILSGVIIIARERAVSRVQANLNTRNTRSVGAPMMRHKELDE
jgi:S-adenosylmethionine uptake transporter